MQLLLRVGSLRRQQLGLEGSEAEGDLFVSEVLRWEFIRMTGAAAEKEEQ